MLAHMLHAAPQSSHHRRISTASASLSSRTTRPHGGDRLATAATIASFRALPAPVANFLSVPV